MTATKPVSDQINYSNRKKLNTDFSHKDLKRSNCFASDFTGSNFSHSSLKAAQFKNCNFTDCNFESAEFVATNLRNTKFNKAILKNVVFDSAKLDGVSFENTSFDHVTFVNTDLSKVINFHADDKNINIIKDIPELNISKGLERNIKASKKNEFIKRSGVLDTKTGGINPVSIMLLLELFSDDVLTLSFSKFKTEINQNFSTLSFLINEINKLVKSTTE